MLLLYALEFQRLYTPTAFREERILWRAVIQLNIVRSIRIILEAISVPFRGSSSPSKSPYSSPKRKARAPQYPESIYGRNGESSKAAENRQLSGDEFDVDSDFEYAGRRLERFTSFTMPSALETLKARLLPLRHIEALLIAKLVPPNEEEPTQLVGPSQTVYPPSVSSHPYPPLPPHLTHHRQHSDGTRDQEIFVRANHEWKGALARARGYGSSPSNSDHGEGPSKRRAASLGEIGTETPDEAQRVLHACSDDIFQLWHDENVREILRRKKIRLEESPGL